MMMTMIMMMGGDDDNGPLENETNLVGSSKDNLLSNFDGEPVENTEVLQKEYVTQGANKRKRVDLVQKKMGTATEDQQQVPMVIIDPFAAMRDAYGELTEEFWQKAPIEAVHVEFERRMGPERTMRKHRFVEDLLASSNASTFNAEQVSSYQEEDMDDHSDHIILEMEERRGAGFVLDQFVLFTAETVQKAETMVVSQVDMEWISTSKVHMRQEESIVIDKYQVGRKIISSEYNALQKIREDYDQADEWMDTDRGAVGPIPPPVP